MRNLVLVLGDQLDPNSSALDDFDARNDLVWMAELLEESKHVWSAKSRIVVFLSAMRHFAADLADRTHSLHYLVLGKNNTAVLPTPYMPESPQFDRNAWWSPSRGTTGYWFNYSAWRRGLICP